MRKFLSTLSLVAIVAVGTAACSGGSSSRSASDLYSAFVADYGYVAEEFGVSTDESFQDYVADLDDCSTLDGEGTAMVTVLIGATLTEHGDDVASFVGDLNALLTAVNAEGLCGSTAATAPTPTTSTTTDDSALRDICAEGMDLLNEGLTSISEGTSLLPYVDDATAREFLATAKKFVQTSKTTVSLCSSLDPDAYAETYAALDSLETAIKSAESLY